MSKETSKQRLEKYSERFDNDDSLIGNPETWGKRLVEDVALKLYPEDVSDHDSCSMVEFDCNTPQRTSFILGATWQAERSYSEEEVLAILHNYRNHFELYRNIQVLPNEFFKWFKQFQKPIESKS